MPGRLSKLLRLRTRRTASLIAQDAAALIAAYGESAYEEARTRAREQRFSAVIDANRPRDHWDRVRQEIARITGRQAGPDAATRYIER